MRITESKFHKVWKIEAQNGFTKINLGDSSKNKDGKYVPTMTIFSFEVTKRGEQKTTEGFAPFEEYSNQFESVDDSDCDVPF